MVGKKRTLASYSGCLSLQRALASRLRDLEMFSAGIAQQMIRRQERMQRALAQLEKGVEESKMAEVLLTY